MNYEESEMARCVVAKCKAIARPTPWPSTWNDGIILP